MIDPIMEKCIAARVLDITPREVEERIKESTAIKEFWEEVKARQGKMLEGHKG